MASVQRVTVCVGRAGALLPLHQCIFHAAGLADDVDEANFKYEFDGSSLLLKPDRRGVPLMHAPDCPTREARLRGHLKDVQQGSADERGTDVGVAVLVTSRDDHVLITRRAAHMRTFANGWVPPGGHVELGEKLEQAAFRELHEEVGLAIPPDTTSSVLGLWESVYPRTLDDGLPTRHHIVVYIHVQLQSEHTRIPLKLCEHEVGAAAWLHIDQAAAVTGLRSFRGVLREAQATLPDGSSERVSLDGDRDSAPLSQRMTYGTHFALRQLVQGRNKL